MDINGIFQLNIITELKWAKGGNTTYVNAKAWNETVWQSLTKSSMIYKEWEGIRQDDSLVTMIQLKWCKLPML